MLLREEDGSLAITYVYVFTVLYNYSFLSDKEHGKDGELIMHNHYTTTDR